MNRGRLEAVLAEHRVDALIATAPENILYASGYGSFQGSWNRFPKAAVVVAGDHEPLLTVPMAEIGFVSDSTAPGDCRVQPFGVSNFRIDGSDLDPTEEWIAAMAAAPVAGPVQAIGGFLQEKLGTGARVAVDGGGAPELFPLLAADPGGIEYLGGGEDLWRIIRMVKTAAEVDLLERAAKVNEVGIQAVLARLGTVPDAELTEVFRTSVAEEGGTAQHFFSGAGRLAGAHRYPHDLLPDPGQRWRCDAGTVVAGYCADTGATAIIAAEPTAAERTIYDAISAGAEAGLQGARPGVAASALYSEVIQAVKDNGFQDYEFPMCGHAIGLEPRDHPILSARPMAPSAFRPDATDPLIEVGMVLNVEVPVLELGTGGYQHEITFVVESTANRLLSPLRELYVTGGK
jgi:Xaa-Pro aminopeptidase